MNFGKICPPLTRDIRLSSSCSMEDFCIIETQDGSHTVVSPQFGVTYHSRYGALRESRHVFIEAGLAMKIRPQKPIAILELGFGSGLNALLAALEAERNQCNIYYETIEAYPMNEAHAEALNYPEQLGMPERKALLMAMHRAPFGQSLEISPYFCFKKIHAQFEQLKYAPQFDVVFFDAFAPETQPELWTEEVLGIMFDALLPGGILVTYCAKGAVKRTLRALGFEIESIPGPPGKREMTRAKKI